MGDKGSTRRSRARLSTWRRHRKEMLGPWSYALLASFVSVELFFVGIVPLWVMAAFIPAMFVTYLVWNRKTDPVNSTWGEGARGEFRVGAEFERLHKHSFHVFHDWDSGRG